MSHTVWANGLGPLTTRPRLRPLPCINWQGQRNVYNVTINPTFWMHQYSDDRWKSCAGPLKQLKHCPLFVILSMKNSIEHQNVKIPLTKIAIEQYIFDFSAAMTFPFFFANNGRQRMPSLRTSRMTLFSRCLQYRYFFRLYAPWGRWGEGE